VRLVTEATETIGSTRVGRIVAAGVAIVNVCCVTTRALA